MTTQPPPLDSAALDELSKLSAEVDRLHGHFVDGGGKSMGVAQQLFYAEEELGAAMVKHRLSLIAAARELEPHKCGVEGFRFLLRAAAHMAEQAGDADKARTYREVEAELLDTMSKAPPEPTNGR